MKLKNVFTILLFLFLFLFVSCNNASNYFVEGNYSKTIEVINNKKALTKNDYLMKIKSFDNLGRIDEAKESILLYLLMEEENSEDRAYALNLYTKMDFPDVLNILIIKESDSIAAQILKYKSYSNLGMYTEAKSILSDYLASELSIENFATLLVAYPVDNDYTYSFFNAWFNILNSKEKNTFYSLFFYYIKTDISLDLVSKCFDLINLFDDDVFFKESSLNYALLLKNKGLLCEKMNNLEKAAYYYNESYKLNPSDAEIVNKIK